jgi:bacillithiol system protein YtxJ
MLRPVLSESHAETLYRSSGALFFKHSTRCAVSFHALDEVERFLETNPEVEVHLVDVLRHRAVSDALARWSGVRHRSPQALLVEEGRVVWHTSHEGVTAEALAERAAVAAPA